MLTAAAAGHAQAHSASSAITLFLFAAPSAIAVCCALLVLARVLRGLSHPRGGTGRFLLACAIFPFAAWLSRGAGPHAAADLLLSWLGAFFMCALFVSSSVAASASN
jgi:hypothetical protein